MGEISLNLSQARLARGLTLEDAERSTRIAKKFLVALEEHNYSIFPAPVYARGFLRTYCRYLDLDPEQQLAELPLGWTGSGTTSTQLPRVSRPITLNYAWLIAGAVLAAILLGAYLMSRGSTNLDDLQARLDQQRQQEQASSASGADGAIVSASDLDKTPQGIVPNFVGVNVDESLAFLTGRNINYLVIQTPDTEHAAGMVIAQSPPEGTAATQGSTVTLSVSTGTAQKGAVRTDCATLAASSNRSADEQAWFAQNCSASPTALPDRKTCDEIRGTEYRSGSEREFFLANCITG